MQHKIISRAEAKARGLKRYFTGEPCKRGHVAEYNVSSEECIQCKRENAARYYAKNNGKVREKVARYRAENPEKLCESNARYYIENREKIHERKVRYRAENLDKEREYKARWRAENADKMREYNSGWRAKNSERIRDYNARYRTENAEKRREYQSHYRAENHDKERQRKARWRIENLDKIRERGVRYYTENKERYAAHGSKRRARKLNATPAWDTELTDLVSQEAFALAKRRESVTGFAWHVDHMIPLQARNACGFHTWSNLQVIPQRLNLAKGNRLKLTEPGEWIRHL